jgi:hypothetical protein
MMDKKPGAILWIGVLFLVGSLLVACNTQESLPTPTSAVYRPPTQALIESPTAVTDDSEGLQSEDLRPTPEPACTNALWFFGDLTIPDGTVVFPGQRLDKRWLVKNAGTCNWDHRYKVRLEAGPNLGVPAQQALFPARGGVELTIRMNFIAPEDPGTYRSAWQAYDPEGV